MLGVTRDLTTKIEQNLLKDEIALVIGARQAGKTTVLHQLEEIIKKQNYPSYFLDLEDPDYLALLNQSPKNLLRENKNYCLGVVGLLP